MPRRTRAKRAIEGCETMFHNQLQRFALVFHYVKDGALGAMILAYIIIDKHILSINSKIIIQKCFIVFHKAIF